MVPLIAQRRPAGRTLAMGIGLVCTVTLDFVLVPAQGGFGAALASTLSYTVVGAVVAVIFARTLDAGGHDLIPRPRDLLAFARGLTHRFHTRITRDPEVVTDR